MADEPEWLLSDPQQALRQADQQCDPTCRTNMTTGRRLARWRDMLQWMLPRTHLLKISEEDLSLLLPGSGCSSSPRARSGAGDTFQAALLTWLAEHGCLSIEAPGSMSASQLREALQFAVRAAAITCSRRGADLPRRSELDR